MLRKRRVLAFEAPLQRLALNKASGAVLKYQWNYIPGVGEGLPSAPQIAWKEAEDGRANSTHPLAGM